MKARIKTIIATVANQMTHKRLDDKFSIIKDRVMSQIDKAIDEGRFGIYLSCKDYSDCPNWAIIEHWLKGLGYRTEYAFNYTGMLVYWDDFSIAENETK